MLVGLTSTAGICWAQGEHSRRAAAELRVLLGDVRMLQELEMAPLSPIESADDLNNKASIDDILVANPRTQKDLLQKSLLQKSLLQKSLIKKGLMDRVRGSLSALDILLRQAGQEIGQTPKSYSATVKNALALADTQQWGQLDALLVGLRKQFRLVPLQIPASKALLDSARRLHKGHCAACHDNPYLNTERPAYNLFIQSQTTPVDEFFARMLTGVRGDRITGIDNPLSDTDIAGLIYYYRTTLPNR